MQKRTPFLFSASLLLLLLSCTAPSSPQSSLNPRFADLEPGEYLTQNHRKNGDTLVFDYLWKCPGQESDTLEGYCGIELFPKGTIFYHHPQVFVNHWDVHEYKNMRHLLFDFSMVPDSSLMVPLDTPEGLHTLLWVIYMRDKYEVDGIEVYHLSYSKMIHHANFEVWVSPEMGVLRYRSYTSMIVGIGEPSEVSVLFDWKRFTQTGK